MMKTYPPHAATIKKYDKAVKTAQNTEPVFIDRTHKKYVNLKLKLSIVYRLYSSIKRRITNLKSKNCNPFIVV